MHVKSLILATLLPLSALAAPALSPADQAAALINQLRAGQFEQAHRHFDAQMAQAVSLPALSQVWQQLETAFGTLQEVGKAEVKDINGRQVILQTLRFERGNVRATTAVSADGKISGFHLAPVADAAPAPAADAAFIEKPLQIDAGPGPLAATLSLPKGQGPFPAVVLVHGSGPQDRDETIGPNKPFADIAHGLAARGIAVLRYDKRSQARPQDFANGVSLALETTDDATAAVKLLKQQAGIDAGRVFVLGHSQGGMVAGRIATAAQAAGAILFAAPARPILDLLREQNVHLMAQSPQIPAEAAKAHMDQLDAAIAALRSDPAAILPALPGLTGAYWQEVEAVDVVADTRASGLPTLLLQGGRDFQVVDTDWQLLKAGLTGERFTFHHYPALNHLGIAGEGISTLADYQTPGKVSDQLIGDIATWIHAR